MHSTLDHIIDRLVDRGDQPLVLAFTAERARPWSYRDVGEQVRVLAGALRSRVEPGEAVALLGPDRAEWIIAALAIVRAGSVVTPIDAQFASGRAPSATCSTTLKATP